MKSFDELKLSAPLAKAIAELGYTAPTDIQRQALPILLGAPTDFIGQAATGTGKTAAFGVPLLELVDPSKKVVQGLILCPTRELAVQVSGQISLFGKHKGVKAVPIYGGASYAAQIDGLKHGAAIVVGTPGRLIDLIDRGALKLAAVKTVVLDEADEMISMGFKEELEKILSATPRDTSHIWLFSATMSPGVRRVADAYLRKPKQVQINRGELLSSTVEQSYFLARESDKVALITSIVESADEFYGLVFCQTKALVMDVTQAMIERGYKVDSLHGDKSQQDRDRTMKAFREKKLTMLVCTDVASRGLDVKELTHVINFSIPREMDVYVHRIGRTARSGKSGQAISLVSPANRHMISRIEHMTKSRMKEGKLPTRQELGARKVAKILAEFQKKEKYFRAAEFLGPDWEVATDEMDLKEIIARFLCLLTPETFEDAKPVALASIAAKPPMPYHRKPDHKGHYKKRPHA
ncbi:MAG: DEAD/DEAH box helicase [Elusimicrobia bacterium]|nr:DEAD/DEAH box helicase [Elusimicrobiota bacterium]